MRPGKEFDQTKIASPLSSQTSRRIFLAASVPDSHEVQNWDVTGAYMRALNNPNIRVKLFQPTRADGTYKKLGKICVIRHAMHGDPAGNEQ